MMKYKMSMAGILICVGAITAGFILANEALIVIGLLCATINCSVYSLCEAATAPLVCRVAVPEEDGEEEE